MSMLGYLITIGNLTVFSDRAALTDVSIQMDSLQNLTNVLLNQPDFPIDGFRRNGYYRVGNTGKYLSKDLQNFLFYKQGNWNDEGVILTLQFGEPEILEPTEDNDSVQGGRNTIFVHRNPISDYEREQVKALIKSRRYPRN